MNQARSEQGGGGSCLRAGGRAARVAGPGGRLGIQSGRVIFRKQGDPPNGGRRAQTRRGGGVAPAATAFNRSGGMGSGESPTAEPESPPAESPPT